MTKFAKAVGMAKLDLWELRWVGGKRYVRAMKVDSKRALRRARRRAERLGEEPQR